MPGADHLRAYRCSVYNRIARQLLSSKQVEHRPMREALRHSLFACPNVARYAAAMKRIALLLALLIAAPALQAQAPSEVERRARWERLQAGQRKFEHRLFSEAGFVPIAELRAEGRVVRRLLLADPYMILPVPGIELERLADGRVTLRLQYPGWSSEPVPVDATAWDALASIEGAVFERPVFRPTPPRASPQSPPPLCHGWILRFEADYHRTASWAQCGGGKTPAYDYAIRLVQLAIGTKPGCTFEPDNPFFSFNKCFMATQALDDPELEAKFGVLRKEYDEAPAADRLAEARRALKAPELALGSTAWLDARAAVRRFREVQKLREDRLQQLRQLASEAVDASDADKAKMQRTIEHWSDFVRSQEPNYSDLLQRLVWAGE
jgi:hypothetical protein